MLIAFSEELKRIAFTPLSLREAWTRRIEIFYEEYLPLLEQLTPVTRVEPLVVSKEELLRAHDAEYIEFVAEMSRRGKGFLDYGDTPAYPGVFEDALKAVSATFTLAAHLLEKGGVGFNPNGGFHHARRRSAGGFCVFNDLALTALWLRERGVKRVAIIDIDAHHGDGTQQILYREDILKVSIHGYGYGFYPGTGWIDELGEGRGHCMNVNIPVPVSSGDDVFEIVLEKIVERILHSYEPEFLILQAGVDGHEGDPLTSMRLTEKSYVRFAKLISLFRERGVPVLVTGGGGYVPETVARIWTLMLAVIVGASPEKFLLGTRGTKSSEQEFKIALDRVMWLERSLEKCHLI